MRQSVVLSRLCPGPNVTMMGPRSPECQSPVSCVVADRHEACRDRPVLSPLRVAPVVGLPEVRRWIRRLRCQQTPPDRGVVACHEYLRPLLVPKLLGHEVRGLRPGVSAVCLRRWRPPIGTHPGYGCVGWMSLPIYGLHTSHAYSYGSSIGSLQP